jgi:hypothetical protein
VFGLSLSVRQTVPALAGVMPVEVAPATPRPMAAAAIRYVFIGFSSSD